MRKPTTLDWLGATVIWSFVSIASGVILSEGMGAPEELGVMLCFGMFFSGVVGARLWWLRRPEPEPAPRHGLTTGEVQGEVFAELEDLRNRVMDLEERADFAERLMLRAGERVAEERENA